MQAEPEIAEVKEVVEEATELTGIELAHARYEALCKWAKESIPGLGKAKEKDTLDPEQLVPEPCNCEHTNHGLHWIPARRTKEWAEYLEALEEEENDA